MAQKVLLLHGWGGSDFPHWQSWLAGELAKEYGDVKFLRFSDFDTPKLDVWMLELQQALMEFTPDVVICHSLANTLWFHLCNHSSIREVKKIYLVAPPSLRCSIPELAEFFPLEAPTSICSQTCKLVVSSNDPYMTLDEAKELQNSLGVEMKVLENAGHINSDSGYGEWPWILQELRKA